MFIAWACCRNDVKLSIFSVSSWNSTTAILWKGTTKVICYPNFSTLYETCRDKTNDVVFKQIRYKPNSASIEDGLRLEILDSERGGFVLCVL